MAMFGVILTTGTIATALSTVAATIAGLFGLILTAAVFRITRIDQSGTNLARHLSGSERFRKHKDELERIAAVFLWRRFTQRWHGYDNDLKAIETDESDDTADARRWCWVLERLADRLDTIKYYLRRAFWVTLITVLACFIAVFLADGLAANPPRPVQWEVLIYPIGVAVTVCMALYAKLIHLLVIDLEDAR